MKNSLFILFLLLGLTLYSQNDCYMYKSNIRYLECSNGYITTNKYPVTSENRYLRNLNIDYLRLDSINYNIEKCLNEFRREYNCPPLTHLKILDELAKLQCDYNYYNHTTGHYNSKYGEDVGLRAQYLGITTLKRVGEVCMYRQHSLLEFPSYKSINLDYVRDVMDYYWLSPLHRNCLLNLNYVYYGFYNHYNKDTKEYYNVMIVGY